MESSATGGQPHVAWWPHSFASHLQSPASGPAGQSSYLESQPASADAGGAPAAATQQEPGLTTGHLQPPDPSASAHGLASSYLQPRSVNTAGDENSYTSSAAHLREGDVDRLASAGFEVSSPIHAGPGDGASTAASGSARSPAAYEGGSGSAEGSGARHHTWNAAEDLAGAAGDGLGMVLLPGVGATDDHLRSRPSEATAGQEATGTAAVSLQATPGAAGMMTVHTAVTLPPQSDGAGMTVRTAVSLPAQHGAVGTAGYGAEAALGLLPSTAYPLRSSADADGAQHRSQLDTYAPFTAEQLAARTGGPVSGANVPGGVLTLRAECHCSSMSRCHQCGCMHF